MLREQIAELKADLKDKKAPFGVDLLLPQVGGSARKTKSVKQSSVLRSNAHMVTATITPRVSLVS